MDPLRRWWHGRRLKGGDWAALFAPAPASEWVSLDLETTGLDPRHDAILSLAAVPVREGRVLLSERFERLVQPEREFDIESIRHHRIVPAEVESAQTAPQVVADFLSWLGPRRLIGYHLRFDLAMLAPAVRALLGCDLPHPTLDVAALYARERRLVQPEGEIDLGLDRIAAELGIPLLARHTALGDACTTALVFLALRHRARGGDHSKPSENNRAGGSSANTPARQT